MGTTALVALVADRRLYVAHVGDSRAMLVSRRGVFTVLTKDHSAEAHAEEQARVVGAGGWIESGRVSGLLSMTRSIGDEGVGAGIIAEPEILAWEIGAFPWSAFPTQAADGAVGRDDGVDGATLRTALPSGTPATGAEEDARPDAAGSAESTGLGTPLSYPLSPSPRTSVARLPPTPRASSVDERLGHEGAESGARAPPADEEHFLVLATDGLWSVVSNDEVASVVVQSAQESEARFAGHRRDSPSGRGPQAPKPAFSDLLFVASSTGEADGARDLAGLASPPAVSGAPARSTSTGSENGYPLAPPPLSSAIRMAAQRLVALATMRHPGDDVTVMIVDLKRRMRSDPGTSVPSATPVPARS